MAKDSGNEEEVALRAEAQKLLEEIKQFRAQAEEQFKAAETARKNADSEGLFAINAKRVCEEHSTAISQLKGTAEAEVNSIVTNKQKVDEVASSIIAAKPVVDTNLAGITESGKVIGEKEKQIVEGSNAILDAVKKSAATVQEIGASKKSAEALVVETGNWRDAAIESREKAKTALAQIEQLSAKADGLAETISAAQVLGTQESAKISGMAALAKEENESVAEIISHLKEGHEIAKGFETRIAKSSQDLEALIKKADSLLPGFTSVSLASAFGTHKKRFFIPKIVWIATFVLCMAGLIAVAYPSFRLAVADKPIERTWEEICRGFAMRLPIVIPLVWLAIYAGRNYMLSIRLEEDYAYKEAISISFEGYKREMDKIEAGDATNPTPLTKLCLNVLTAIAERPGRVYEGKHQDFTLISEAREVLEKADELRKKTTAVQ